MRDPVAHLQTQAQVHLVGHAQGQAARRRRVGLGAAHQALGELVGQGVLHAPLGHLAGPNIAVLDGDTPGMYRQVALKICLRAQ